jgi:hypothetical protein
LGAAAVILADFDGDSAPDAVVATRGSDPTSVLYGDGLGALGLAVQIVGVRPFDWRSVATGDVNGDHRPDVVLLSTDELQVVINELVTPPPVCTGDCDQNRMVSIDEVVLGVSLALDGRGSFSCRLLDADGSNRIEINELIAAVGNALAGCPTG